MEEKKVTKISLSTFFLILAIIVIIVISIFMFKLYNEKTAEIKKSSELQTQVNKLNGTVSDLQGKIDNISETINSNNSTENITTTNTSNNNNTSFSDEQVKTSLSNYLELSGYAQCSELINYLQEKGKLNYDSSKDYFYDNSGTVLTNIKFEDYKNTMLNYISESEFEKNWTSEIGLSKSDSGYLIRSLGGGGLRSYTINSIKKMSDFTYTAQTTMVVDYYDNTKKNFTFTIKSFLLFSMLSFI